MMLWIIAYMAYLLQSLPHFLRNLFHAKFNLFLFPFPYLLSKDIPGFEQESLSHKEKGYARSFTHRTTELSSCEGRTFWKRSYFS